MDEITIRGTMSDFRMTVILPNALPLFSIGDFKKFLKVIDEDFEHRDELLETVDKWIEDRLLDIPSFMKKKANEYHNAMQWIKDHEHERDEIREEIKNKRTKGFTPLTKDQIETRKQNVKDLGSTLMIEREVRNDALRDFKLLEREQKKLQKEKEVIKKWQEERR